MNIQIAQNMLRAPEHFKLQKDIGAAIPVGHERPHTQNTVGARQASRCEAEDMQNQKKRDRILSLRQCVVLQNSSNVEAHLAHV